MDITALIEVINTVGFPIACVVAMYYLLHKEQESHKEEMGKLVEALNNNTIVLEHIKALLSVGGGEK